VLLRLISNFNGVIILSAFNFSSCYKVIKLRILATQRMHAVLMVLTVHNNHSYFLRDKNLVLK
jgi:hypothetical protein